MACHVFCKSRGVEYIALFVNALRIYGGIHGKLTIITCEGARGSEPIRDTSGGETFYHVLFHILSFELGEGIIYSKNVEGEGMHRYDLRYIVIEVKLKGFRYACMIIL